MVGRTGSTEGSGAETSMFDYRRFISTHPEWCVICKSKSGVCAVWSPNDLRGNQWFCHWFIAELMKTSPWPQPSSLQTVLYYRLLAYKNSVVLADMSAYASDDSGMMSTGFSFLYLLLVELFFTPYMLAQSKRKASSMLLQIKLSAIQYFFANTNAHKSRHYALPQSAPLGCNSCYSRTVTLLTFVVTHGQLPCSSLKVTVWIAQHLEAN